MGVRTNSTCSLSRFCGRKKLTLNAVQWWNWCKTNSTVNSFQYPLDCISLVIIGFEAWMDIDILYTSLDSWTLVLVDVLHWNSVQAKRFYILSGPR